MFDIPVLVVASSLMIDVANKDCKVAKAPIINVTPITKNIQYDFKKTTAELSAMQSNTVNPYGLGADTTTGGLRHDQPSYSLSVEVDADYNPETGAYCLWYKKIDLTIKLQPKIYIAKEYNIKGCGEAILKHEKKHVKVDRILTNKYAEKVGQSLVKAVNQMGAAGPYNKDKALMMRKQMIDNVRRIIEVEQVAHANEQNKYQQQVDSREEYERVSAHCEHVKLDPPKDR